MPNEFVTRNGLISLNNSQITGSLSVTQGVTGSLFGTSSWSDQSLTASYIGLSESASYAATASSADNFYIRQNVTASNALLTGTLTAQTLVVQTVSSSVVYSSGSNTFGNLPSNIQQFTGSLRVTGSDDHYIVGGDFGIGTISPLYPLEIASTNATSLAYQRTGVSAKKWGFITDNSATYWSNITDNTLPFTLTNGGSAGIGTISPTAKLQVSGSTNLVNFIGSGSGIFSIDGTAGRLFQVNDGLSGSLFSVNTAAGLPVMEAFSDNTVRIGQFGQRALFVSQSKVGIGKESPLNGTLDVSGSVTITGSLNSVAMNSYTQAASGFSKSFAIINNNNIGVTDTGSFPVWRCNVPCTASAINVYFDTGTNAVVNGKKNTSNLLAANLTNSSANTWATTTTLQNQNFAIGDTLFLDLISFSGTPKEITIQANFIY